MRADDEILAESADAKDDPNHFDEMKAIARLQLEVLLDIREYLSRMAPRDWVTRGGPGHPGWP